MEGGGGGYIYPLIHFYLFSKVDGDVIKNSSKSHITSLLTNQVLQTIQQHIPPTPHTTTSSDIKPKRKMSETDGGGGEGVEFEVMVEESRIVRDVSPNKSFSIFVVPTLTPF